MPMISRKGAEHIDWDAQKYFRKFCFCPLCKFASRLSKSVCLCIFSRGVNNKQMIRFSAVWWACTELGHILYNPGMYNYLSKCKIVSGHVILAYFCDLHSQLLPSWFTRRFPQLQSTVGSLPSLEKCKFWARGFSANAIQSKFSKVRIEWWGSSSSSSTSFKIWMLIINCWCYQFQIKMSMIKTGNWTDKLKFNNLF